MANVLMGVCVFKTKKTICISQWNNLMQKEKNKLHSETVSLSCLKYFFFPFSSLSMVIRGRPAAPPHPLLLYKQTTLFVPSPSFSSFNHQCVFFT